MIKLIIRKEPARAPLTNPPRHTAPSSRLPLLAVAPAVWSNGRVLRRMLEGFWPSRRAAHFDDACPA